MANLNYHHLRYFHAVAHEGNLGRAAERLNVAQSALSMQIKSLEERLGQSLFERVGRSLVLTEAGRIALDHADRIFGAGEELIAALDRSATELPPLRIGAASTLSRNFQMMFLRPAIASGNVDIVLRSGPATSLLEGLRTLALDVVLTTEIPEGDAASQFAADRISEQPVGLHGRPEFMQARTLPKLLTTSPLILPTETTIRLGFEGLCARLKVEPHVVASVDDMAMVRLLTREGAGVALAPAVVLSDEIASGRVVSAGFDLQITEPFFALTLRRKYPHPLLEKLLKVGTVVPGPRQMKVRPN